MSTHASRMPSVFSSDGGGGFTFVRKTADETIADDTVLSDDSELLFPMDASSVYIAYWWILYTHNATPDFKLAFSIPTGASGTRIKTAWNSDAPNLTLDVTTSESIVGGGISDATLPLYTTIVNGTTAGDCNFQWAQNTTSATTVTVKENSMVMWAKIG